MEPIIRAGETYPLASDMSKADALDYWYGPEDEIFVVKEGDEALGTYHLRPNCAGGGSHIANVGYIIDGHWQRRRTPDGRTLIAASSKERLQSHSIQLRCQHERTRSPAL